MKAADLGLTCEQVFTFRNAATDEEKFEACLQSLEAELMFNAGHLITVEQPEVEGDPEEAKEQLKKKPGRAFCHALSLLYICDPLTELDLEKTPVELTDQAAQNCYWEEVKGQGCKFYRNSQTKRYLGYDSDSEQVFSVSDQSECEEWLLLVDQSDQSPNRAVIIKTKTQGDI
ncbi:hypothetical protein WMY93_005890 [Mugilogobius chulae]|uniref:Uncharacterized protein n=1 Tax=Mugilogobius chulae TaxID=88201 RepID=A0AAW0PII1_9GOBI